MKQKEHKFKVLVDGYCNLCGTGDKPNHGNNLCKKCYMREFMKKKRATEKKLSTGKH